MPLIEMPTTVSIGSWPVSSAVTSAMMSPMASMLGLDADRAPADAHVGRRVAVWLLATTRHGVLRQRVRDLLEFRPSA